MFLIFLFLVALSRPISAHAGPILSATLSSSTVRVGESFSIFFNVYDLNINASYNAKAFGVPSSYDFQTLNGSNWLNFNSAWSSFPVFTTGLGTSLNSSIVSRVGLDKPPGNNSVNLKICEISPTENCYLLSPPLSLTVLPLPTASPTPTITPLPTAINTPIPSATPTPTITGPSISVSTVPSSIKIGENVSVNFTINNSINGHNYAVKVIGGSNNNGFQTQKDGDWLNLNSAWADFPKHSSSNGSINSSLTFRVNPNQSTGTVNIAFKAYNIDNSKDFQTSAQEITINSADPSSTPAASATITNSPSPKTTPTTKLSPTPTDEPLPSEEPVIEPTSPYTQVQGISISITPTPTPKKSNPSVLPFIFIGFGAILLITPFVLAKIKK